MSGPSPQGYTCSRYVPPDDFFLPPPPPSSHGLSYTFRFGMAVGLIANPEGGPTGAGGGHFDPPHFP